jgi:hypothetical protein
MDDVMSAEVAPKAKDRSRFGIFYERDAPSLDTSPRRTQRQVRRNSSTLE